MADMQKNEISTSDPILTALSSQYRDAVAMLSETNGRRTSSARFYISLVSGLVGLLAIVLRPGTDVTTQLWLTNLIALSSVFLCSVWFMIIRALRHKALVQRSLITEMEQSLPFAFITRLEQNLTNSARSLNPGLIEQALPLLMMLPAIVIMLATNFL